MSDRELLELAAKAAGIDYRHDNSFWTHEDYCAFWSYDDLCNCGARWNPLNNDDNAFRLAVKLGLTVAQLMSSREVLVNDYDETVLIGEFHEADPGAATRRAITRAAAEIGAGLRPFPTAEEIREDWLGGT